MRQKFRDTGRGTPYSRPLSAAEGYQAQLPTIILAGLHLISPFGPSGVQGEPFPLTIRWMA